MIQITGVSHEQHAGKRWRRFADYRFAAQTALVPLAPSELGNAARAMPIAFIRQNEKYVPVAVMSPTPGNNLFVAPNGRWVGGYTPAVFRAHPFRLVPRNDNSGFILCITDEQRMVVEGSEAEPDTEPFFDEEGKLSAATQFVLDFLTEFERSRSGTEGMMSVLETAGIIKPWQLETHVDGQERVATGLHCIDEAAMRALSDAEFLTLRRHSALAVAYAQILSMGHLRVLEQLGRLRAEAAHASSRPVGGQAPSGLQLADDGELHFE